MTATHATALAVWVLRGRPWGPGDPPGYVVTICGAALTGMAFHMASAEKLLRGETPERWPIECPKCAVLVDAAMGAK